MAQDREQIQFANTSRLFTFIFHLHLNDINREFFVNKLDFLLCRDIMQRFVRLVIKYNLMLYTCYVKYVNYVRMTFNLGVFFYNYSKIKIDEFICRS